MSRFNSKTGCVTYEGAPAVEKNALDDFINNIFSNNLQGSFYESADSRLERLMTLTETIRMEYGDAFVAKLAKFSRTELGMRSVAHVVAGMLNDSKMESKRGFYREFCTRPDDCAEILAFLDVAGVRPSHAMIRGFCDYISSLSEYTLGKYKMSGKKWNIYDIVNITHAHSAAIDKLKMDAIETPDTWEVAISGAENEDERNSQWVRLVEEHKLGYTALLMNLRNILASTNDSKWWVRDVLCPQITDKNAIFGSMMFPYKIYNAYKNYRIGGIENIDVDHALSTAFEISCSLVPKFDGKTAVLVDVSGSMDSQYSKMSSLTIAEISACYAAAFMLANASGTDVFKFGTNAKKFEFNEAESAFSLINRLKDNEGLGYGTCVESALNLMHEAYDRVIIFSDMQVMSINSYATGLEVEKWREKHKEVYIYSFDLGNYRTSPKMFDEKVKMFTALSPQVFRFLQLTESGKSIAEYINSLY